MKSCLSTHTDCDVLSKGINKCFVIRDKELLLDQLGAVVDGCPMEKTDVLLIWLPDVISCFHQLLTALKDPKSANRSSSLSLFKAFNLQVSTTQQKTENKNRQKTHLYSLLAHGEINRARSSSFSLLTRDVTFALLQREAADTDLKLLLNSAHQLLHSASEPLK